jgi:hypothetical protein
MNPGRRMDSIFVAYVSSRSHTSQGRNYGYSNPSSRCLEWVNSEFTASAWLYMFGQTGFTYANIKGKDISPKAMTTNSFLHACPVVLAKSKKF